MSASDKPDLHIELPDTPRTDQVAPIYVDAYQRPGRLLYRFDAVIANDGGALDLYRDLETGHAFQAIWPGGIPSPSADPNRAPGGDALLEDRSSEGGSFVYVTSNSPETDGHNHWHLLWAARYELLAPDGARVIPKVGFCMYDSWRGEYFVPNFVGVGPNTWCAPHTSDTTFVRMGLSPSGGDIYRSQVAFQWVDVTGLAPGQYSLRAVANPRGAIDESNTSDNALLVQRVVPGATADSLEADVAAGDSEHLRLSGTVVGASIPARKSSTCQPSRTSLACYAFADSNGPLQFQIRRRPEHGTLALGATDGLSADAVYMPTPGFSGTDSFTYRTTDARGLTSRTGTVTLHVLGAPPANVVPPTISGQAELGSTLVTAAGEWMPATSVEFGFEWRRCDAAGSLCVPIEGATASSYVVSPADVGSRLQVTVTGSNAGGSAQSSSGRTRIAVVPAPSLVREGRFLGTSKRIRLSWLVQPDPSGWLASYDLRYRWIRPDGQRGGAHSWLAGTTTTEATFVGVPGRTYCFNVRARDTLGHVSAWSALECRALPLDDRALGRETVWGNASAEGAYMRTLSTSARAGSVLVRRNVETRTLALLVTRCPDCGEVTVLLDGRALRRVSLASDVRAMRQLVRIARFSRLHSGELVIRVVSQGKHVLIDGLVTSSRRSE